MREPEGLIASRGEDSWCRRLGGLLLLAIVVAWPIRYFQQVEFGQVVLYTGLLRLILFVAIALAALVTAAHQTASHQLRIVITEYAALMLLAFNLILVHFGAFYAAYGFNLFVVPAAVAILFYFNAAQFSVRLAEQRLLNWLVVLALPIALLGILQFFLNDPIFSRTFADPVKSEFGDAGQAAVRLTELASTHWIRASAIFGSALEFGHFATLFAFLCIGLMVRTRTGLRGRALYALLTVTFAAAVLSTNTRNILLYSGCCAGGCVLILLGLRARSLVVLSLMIVVLFYASIYGIIAVMPRAFAGLFDPVSLFQRARGVYVTFQQFVVDADSLTHVLFGYGYMQSLDFKFLPTTVFDNTLLDAYLYAGVLGVILLSLIFGVLFVFSVGQWHHTRGVSWLAVSSLLFGTPLFSTMNIDLDQPFWLFVFALVVSGAAVKSAEQRQPPKPHPAPARSSSGFEQDLKLRAGIEYDA